MDKTPCDFIGFDCTARAIFVEAKTVQRPSLPIGKSPGLAPHQWVALSELHRAGGLALIAWMRKEEIAIFGMDVAEKLRDGRKSIPWWSLPEENVHHVDDPLERLFEPYLCCG